jgi:hypothetical protein
MDTKAREMYGNYLASVENRRRRLQRGWTLAKQTTWLTLLAGGYLMLYLLDIAHQSYELLGVSF